MCILQQLCHLYRPLKNSRKTPKFVDICKFLLFQLNSTSSKFVIIWWWNNQIQKRPDIFNWHINPKIWRKITDTDYNPKLLQNKLKNKFYFRKAQAFQIVIYYFWITLSRERSSSFETINTPRTTQVGAAQEAQYTYLNCLTLLNVWRRENSVWQK